MTEKQKLELVAIVTDLWKTADRLGALRTDVSQSHDPSRHSEHTALHDAHISIIRAANIPAHLIHDIKIARAPLLP